MDHGASINFGDGSRSEEKRPKLWEIGVGQRIRGAMLSVQSKAINKRYVFCWLPPELAPSAKTFFYQPEIWLVYSAEPFF
jgi:hypothetical protein